MPFNIICPTEWQNISTSFGKKTLAHVWQNITTINIKLNHKSCLFLLCERNCFYFHG